MIRRRIRALLKLGTNRLWTVSGLIVRLAFCFGIGLVVLITTQNANYDYRFFLRGPQEVGDDIVIVSISRDDVRWMGGFTENSPNVMWSLKEIVETSDSFFWQPQIWEKVLSQLESVHVRAVAVTLFFGEETVRGTMTASQLQLFSRPNIFWVSKADADGHAIKSGLTRADGKNSGVLDLKSDPDGRVRHFLETRSSFAPLSVKMETFLMGPQKTLGHFHEGLPINFQGPKGTFKSIRFSDLARDRIDLETLAGKIIVFSIDDIPSHQVQTPVGSMSNGELLANLLFEFTHNKEIRPFPFWLNTLCILVLALITLWLVFEYPQSVALCFLIFTSLAVLALSAAFFDLRTIWIPAAAPLASMITTYVVISGYRLSRSEKMSWQSERELHYISEVESLKNNFLSLISHDLKNPLAKIQGITDRLLTSLQATNPEELAQDLQSIKQTSEELRQYIGSILQLTRVEARDIKLTKEVCDINTIVGDVISRILPLAQQKNIEIVQKLEPIFSIEIDRTLITEVLLNLVENAVKYSNIGGSIEIVTQEIDNQVRVEVSDTGNGIPQEEISRVFDKFYRGTGQKTLQVTGTGLGLYLVKYFIELHGGKVFITSKVGLGTRVGFTLPLEALEENYGEFARSHR